MPHQDVPDRVLEQRIIGRQNRPTGIPEHRRDPFPHQGLPQHLRAGSYLSHDGLFTFVRFQPGLRPGPHAVARGGPLAPTPGRANSRFVGFEATASVELASTVWVNLGLGMVDAELNDTNEPLPRIPPLRGQVSVDIPYRGFTVSPEWVFAAAQDQVFRYETETDGYAVYRTNANERKLRVCELMAATDEAYTALWQFCFGVDLIDHTEVLNRPVDDPLVWMLADPRRLERFPKDATWLRLVNVAAALSGRNA